MYEGSTHTKWIESILALDQVGEASGIVAAILHGWSSPEEIDGVIALATAAGQPSDPINTEWDAKPLLGEVRAPTLVLLSREARFASLEEARQLAGGIRDAQMKTIDGTLLPYFADQDAVFGAIAAFLGEEQPTAPSSAGKGFTTIVFTDLVASTEMLGRLGDDEGRAAVRQVEETVNTLAERHDGEVVKNLGDGSMIAFSSTSGALAFAVALMGAMADSPMELRIGMAAGEPIHEDGDIHGAVVAQASRIADVGTAGEIVVAESVHQLALGKGFDFEAAGETKLKGFEEPVSLWLVTGS